LQTEWQIFLENLKLSDFVAFNAISSFKLRKKGEDEIEIVYPSDLAKNEFDKIKDDFFNHFKHKVNHFKIQISYTKDEIGLKKEIITQHAVFEKFAKLNPLLWDLNDLMKFDFS
jgi:DNA polymerase-3 subunit gamma/tau